MHRATLAQTLQLYGHRTNREEEGSKQEKYGSETHWKRTQENGDNLNYTNNIVRNVGSGPWLKSVELRDGYRELEDTAKSPQHILRTLH